MRCRHCNIALAPSRSFVDGEFCCDDHRQRFEAGEPGIAPSILEKLRMIFQRRVAAETSEIAEPAVVEAGIVESEVAQELEAAQEEVLLEAQQYEEPVLEEEPVFAEGVEDQASAYEPSQEAQPQGARETAASWHWLAAAWKAAPRDLKLVSVLLPVLLVIAISGSLPKVPIQQLAPQNLDQVQSQVQKVVALQWKNVNQTISDRAAVAFADDFRAGLDAWESRSNLTRSWSYDAAGFVRPGPLAIFK